MLVAFIVVVLDVFTKELALALLQPGRFVPWIGADVGWQLVFNPGAAFGLRLPPIVFPIVTLVLIGIIGRALSEGQHPLAVVAQGLVVGGAIGNIIDRLARPGDGSLVGGFVVDFVAWGAFPRFNVADAAITVGVALFILMTFLAERAERAVRVDDSDGR